MFQLVVVEGEVLDEVLLRIGGADEGVALWIVLCFFGVDPDVGDFLRFSWLFGQALCDCLLVLGSLLDVERLFQEGLVRIWDGGAGRISFNGAVGGGS